MNVAATLMRRALRLARRSPLRTFATGSVVAAAVLAGALVLGEASGHHARNSMPEPLLGAADARYELWLDGSYVVADTFTLLDRQLDTVLAALPTGSESAVLRSLQAQLGIVEVPGSVSVQQAPWRDPLLDGTVELAAGRLPGPGEVVVQPELAVAAGVDIGDELVLREPAAVLEVVGLGAAASWSQLLVDRDEFVPGDPSGAGAYGAGVSLLVRVPPGEVPPDVALDGAGGVGATGGARVIEPLRSDSLAGPPPDGASATVVAAVVLFVGLSAGAAFGIGAARRRRALGLLAVNGATQAQLRGAIAAESVVVALPAALLGVLAAVGVVPIWVRWRLPGWQTIWQVSYSWPWLALLASAAVLAAIAGAIGFSRSTYAARVTDLLDRDRPSPSPRRLRLRPGLVAAVLAVLAVPLVLPLLGLGVAASTGRAWAVLVAAVAWCSGAALLLVLARRLLASNAVGAIVARDLSRRPLGAAAAVSVVALWCFVALMWTLSPGLGSGDVDDRGLPSDSSGPTSPVVDEFEPSTTLTIRPGPSSAYVHRSVADVGDRPVDWLERLRVELAEVGLQTDRATIGQFTGECAVCPEGFRPSIMVLDSIDGLGLPEATTAALLEGKVVTGFGMDGVDGATVGGLQVAVAPLPLDANAAVLAGSAPEGVGLEQTTEVLVGSTAELSDDEAEAVLALLAGAGVTAYGDERVMGPGTYGPGGYSSSTDDWSLAWSLSAIALLLVTLAATAAHRREHGEAAHVLWILGAGPSAARRLSSLTAGSLAVVGTALGALTAAVVVGAMLVDRVEPATLWSFVGWRQAGAVALVVLGVPAVVTTLARLLPPPRASGRATAPA